MSRRPGRGLLQLPGPTNVPDPVLRAISEQTLDHRGAQFAEMFVSVADDLRPLFGTSEPVAIYSGSGTGGWEAALVNLLSPGDRVLCFETGFFAAGWAKLARDLGVAVDLLEGDWRGPADPERIAAALAADTHHAIRAVLIVHNETSTGVTSDPGAIRAAINSVGHPALFLLDAVSSLGAMAVEHDAWGVDVTITASQKGLMLPPGLAFLAVSPRAREAHPHARLPRAYWEWDPLLDAAATGSTPYTPSSNLIVGLRAALDLIAAEGLPAVFRRHRAMAAAVQQAVSHWGFEFVCRPAAARSASVTAFLLPEGADDRKVRSALLDGFDITFGGGLGRLSGRCLRVGHLGDVDPLMVISALAALELGLPEFVPLRAGGVQSALTMFSAPLGAVPAAI